MENPFNIYQTMPTDIVELIESHTYLKGSEVETYYTIRVNGEYMVSGMNYINIKCIFRWILTNINSKENGN